MTHVPTLALDLSAPKDIFGHSGGGELNCEFGVSGHTLLGNRWLAEQRSRIP